MSADPTLFDLSEGRERKETGMRLALQPVDLSDWKAEFYTSAAFLARSGVPFTSEDVVALVGLPLGDVALHGNNAVGAMMNGLAKRGVIRKTGRHVPSKRPSSHGTEINEWVRA